jgi:hypothetical protein
MSSNCFSKDCIVLAICSTCMFFMALDMPFTVWTIALLICCMRMAVS